MTFGVCLQANSADSKPLIQSEVSAAGHGSHPSLQFEQQQLVQDLGVRQSQLL